MPNLPMTSPWLYLAKSGRIELLLADFTGIADDMRGKSVLRIEAALRVDQFHLGKEIAVRFDKRQLGRGQLFLDDDGIVFGLRAVTSRRALPGRHNPDSILRRSVADAPSSGFRASESGCRTNDCRR